MGVVRFAIGFPHTFYVVAAPILFLGMTAGIKMPVQTMMATATKSEVQAAKLLDMLRPNQCHERERRPSNRHRRWIRHCHGRVAPVSVPRVGCQQTIAIGLIR